MSAKERFLKKLQDQHPRSAAFDTKAKADTAAFRQRISRLQESMETWLAGAEVRTEATTSSLVEFLIGGSAFSVPGIALHYEQQSIRFPPIYATGDIRPLYRLFMRCGERDDRTWCPAGAQSGNSARFDEEAFCSLCSLSNHCT